MLTYVLVALAVAIIGVLVAASMKPDTFRIERSAVVTAAPEQVFAHVNDFAKWSDWSPWEKLDPAMQRTLSGAPSGVGAIYEWQGNKKVGTGRMEISHASAPSAITVQLHFMQPFEARNVAEFTMVPNGSGTRVTWAMSGANPFMFKVMKVFANMDDMVGRDFERGLANLKAVVERA